MPFEPGHFKLADAPLAVVLAQFTLQRAVSSESFVKLRESLRSLGLERMTKKRERSVSITPASINPVVTDFDVWTLIDRMNTKGMAIAGKSLTCFMATHVSFQAFSAYIGGITTAMSACGSTFETTSIALRYVNVFEIGDDPTTVVTTSLGGLNRDGIGKDHHHHTYEFWCDTDYGKLTLRFSTTHGDKKPAQLGHAEVVFPMRFLSSYDEIVGHLDIFAATSANKPLNPPADWISTAATLKTMNLTIERAFLNAINEVAIVSKFKAESK